MRLKDKVAIITGAASGFGAGMARRFAEEGARVVVADLNGQGARRLATEIGPDAVAVQTDVSLKPEIDEMVATALQAFGRIDVMINNAGFTHAKGSLLDVPEDTFDLVTAVNMKAVYHATLAVAPIMRQQGGGSIITTAAMSAIHPQPGLAWYNASKGWVIAATRALAVELAPGNIRVNCLCPLAAETGMLSQFLGTDTSDAREAIRASIPLGRLSTPEDIANAALWLASDEAAFVTGIALEVHGGAV